MATKRRETTDDDEGASQARTRAGDAFSILVIEIFQLNGLLTSAGDALARPWGQTTARWQVLAAVQDEPATVAQIARALHLARQSVQRVADLLEHDGLAAYEDNPGHRRAKLMRLTPLGRETLDGIQAAQRSWANAIGREIGEPNLRRAGEVLDRLALTLERRRIPAGRAVSGLDPSSP